MGSLVLASCLKKKFDVPPDTSKIDPQLPISTSLQNLSLDCQNLGVGKYRTLGDSTIYGIVVGDDRSGNIYKKIFIQDSSGGIQIILDKTNLYGDYPVGRKVYVKLKGLQLMNYKGTPEIVYNVNPDGSSDGIPSSLIGNYLIKGNYPNEIKPMEVSAGDLITDPTPYVNMLVKLNDMQFAATSSDVLYSNASASTNRWVEDCSHANSLQMYNSNYSTFQSAKTPTGNGTIVGIISLYTTSKTSAQLTLRDTSDIKFTNPRCN